MENSLKVELTPIKYLDRDNQSKRNHLQFDSRQAPVLLEVRHDKFNQYDNKALQVFYDNIHIGYIRKRYIDENLTDLIEDLCFKDGILVNVSLECHDGVYTLSSKIIDSSEQRKIKNDNIQPVELDTSKLEKEIDTLIQNMGWIRK